ncbi:MAG: divergent polysaccharide deacetylase family protein, partial [Tabrizicola sp.]|nr:divergent polysaccharide deacetylase family protein [Tabrizicola sp.]
TPETAPQPEAETEPETAAAADPAVEEQPALVTEAIPETKPEDATGDDTEVAVTEGEEEPSSTFASTPGFVAEGTVVEEPTETPVDDPVETDDRPIARYAAAFENPDAKPVMAVILIDTGAADLDRAALAALPFPVSFALDPMDPATPERAAAYRAAGREVIMLTTGIAPGAQASDIEVSFQAMFQTVPEAVAIMDLADPVFQNDRPLATLVVPVVGGQGLGVLTWEKGLNAADQVARRDDIASAVIFRDLAAGGGDAAAAKRTLDRAVFKAGQDQRVVVAGAITPELVAALIEWSVEGRAGAVALGPVTAVLKVD